MKTMRGAGLVFLWAAVCGAIPAAAVEFPLRGLVTDQEGKPLEAVEVRAAGEPGEFLAFTTTDGTFELLLPQGEYDLLFSYGSDFYPTRLSGVRVRVVEDPDFRNPDPGRIHVTLSQRLRFELDQVIIGPRFVDPPPIKVDFRLLPAPKAGAEVTGTVWITNLGVEPLAVPTVLEADYPIPYSRDMLLMQTQVEIPELAARFDRPYVCRPGVDCRVLAASESVQIPITLHTRESHQEESPSAATYPAAGSYSGTVGVYFVHPGGGERPTYTRPAQAEFQSETTPARSP